MDDTTRTQELGSGHSWTRSSSSSPRSPTWSWTAGVSTRRGSTASWRSSRARRARRGRRRRQSTRPWPAPPRPPRRPPRATSAPRWARPWARTAGRRARPARWPRPPPLWRWPSTRRRSRRSVRNRWRSRAVIILNVDKLTTTRPEFWYDPSSHISVSHKQAKITFFFRNKKDFVPNLCSRIQYVFYICTGNLQFQQAIPLKTDSR